MNFFFCELWTPIFRQKAPFQRNNAGDWRYVWCSEKADVGNTCPEIQVRALALICLRATIFIVVRKNVLIFLVRKFTF